MNAYGMPALPVLVVGGGVAGMRAALCLADAGVEVLLAEQEAALGGQAIRLDKVFPTDHCASCLVGPMVQACREHPRIRILLRAAVVRLEEESGRRKAVLRTRSAPVDAGACIFCGLCEAVCPTGAVLRRPATPPAVSIDPGHCDACGKCAAVCPVRAIDLARLNAKEEELRLTVRGCIFATGLYEPRPAPAPEFGGHSHPDILTATAFEAWLAALRSDGTATPLCPSDKRPVRRIAFAQCAGSRDRRFLPHCSAVCCMHAAKQARWLKRLRPELDIVIFHTDLRAPGKGQERYMRRAAEEGIRFVRRRPGLVSPLDPAREPGLLIRHEEDESVRSTIVDMVVLNGGLASCPVPAREVARTAEATGSIEDLVCGFCREPADIAQSVIQGAAAASRFLESTEGSRAATGSAAAPLLASSFADGAPRHG